MVTFKFQRQYLNIKEMKIRIYYLKIAPFLSYLQYSKINLMAIKIPGNVILII